MPVLAVAGQTRTPEGHHPGRLKPRPRWVPGNSGNSGNFLAGSPRENRIFFGRDGGHKDAIDALRRLKNSGATVTWDDRESRVSFEAVSGADQASLDSYRKAAAKVDAYLGRTECFAQVIKGWRPRLWLFW